MSVTELEVRVKALLVHHVSLKAGIEETGALNAVEVRGLIGQDIVIEGSVVHFLLPTKDSYCAITAFNDKGVASSLTFLLWFSKDEDAGGVVSKLATPGRGRLGNGQWWYFRDPIVMSAGAGAVSGGHGHTYVHIARVRGFAKRDPLSASDFLGFMAYPKVPNQR